MYDPLYEVVPAFEAQTGIRVEIAARLPHPELNAFVKQTLEQGERLDLISTHTKYAPSQVRWLLPLDGLLEARLAADLLPRPLELARIGGQLYQVPRNLDVRLLHYRRDLLAAAPGTWSDLFDRPSSRRRIERRLQAGVEEIATGRDEQLVEHAEEP